MTFWALSALVNAVTSFALGLIVYAKNRKSSVNKTFFIFTSCVAFWSAFYFLWQIAVCKESALFMCRLLMVGAALIPPTFFHFSATLVDAEVKFRKIIKILYFLSGVFILLNFYSFIVKDVRPRLFFPFWPTAGIFYSYFLMFFASATIFSLILMFRYYKILSGNKKNQIKYVFVSTSIGFLGGMTNYPLWYDFPIPPFGNIATSITVLIIAYAIIRYRLMDIRLAISNTAIFIAVFALVLGVPFFFGYKYHQWQISTWAMLVLATTGPYIYGYLQRKTESKILKDQELYRQMLLTTSRNLKRFKTTDKIIEHIAGVLFKAIQLKSVAIYLKEGDTLVIKRTNTNEEPYQKEINNKETIGWLITQTQPVVLKEFLNNNSINKHGFNGFLQEQYAEIIVPLISSDHLIGMILLGEKQDGSLFSDKDLNTLSAISDFVALALENALYMEAEKRRDEEENKNKRQFQLDRFASSMAHQIRNPLNIIYQNIGDNVTVFGKYKFNMKEEESSYLENANKEALQCCDRISRTIDTILNFGKGTIELRKIKVSEVLNGFDILNKMILKKYGVKLNVNMEESFPEIFGDVNLIEEVLIIYLDNGCQAVSKNEIRKVDFKVYRANGDYVRFEMSDNGHGIDEKTQKALFDVSTSTKGTEGNGLGLFRVRKICELIEGSKYGFYSGGRGQGAKFWIDLKIPAN